MSRPSPNPRRYIRLLTDNLEELPPVEYPRRLLAALTGVVLLVASVTVRPILLDRSVWVILYVVAGIGLLALAIVGHGPVRARATVAVLVTVVATARVVAIATPILLDGIELVPGTIVGLATWPTIAAHTTALVAFWDRLE